MINPLGKPGLPGRAKTAIEGVMAKDAQGHGSDGRVAGRIQRFAVLADVDAQTRREWMGDRVVASVLGQGHPKSNPVPIHPGAFGRRSS